MRKRILKIIGWTLLGSVLVVGLLAVAFFRHFYAAAPAPSYPKAANALVAQQQDLDYFGTLIARDRAFTREARAEADAQLAKLKALNTPLDHEHLRVALMQIVALADNGHSNSGTTPGPRPRELPCALAIRRRVYVMRAKDEAAELLGGRIVEIDGKPIDEVIATSRDDPRGHRRSGVASTRRTTCTSLGFCTDWMWHRMTARPPGRSFRPTDDGDAYVARLRGSPSPRVRLYPALAVRDPLDGLTDGWYSFQPDRAPPLSLPTSTGPSAAIRLPQLHA